jgi:single-strand DNA-binding protein
VPSYNHCTFVGNLTRDPEIRYLEEGKPVTKFAIAINRKTKSTEEVMYMDVIAWDRLAEIANEFLNKGNSVLVAGRLNVREYEDKDGNKRKAVELTANELQMLTPKPEDQSKAKPGGKPPYKRTR